MTWITTHTGRKFDYDRCQKEDIDINDIAHGLSNLCRFAGQCREFYSVAQHSVIVAYIAEKYAPFGRKIDCARLGLLHDAAEAYIVDLPGPLKNGPGFSRYKLVEERIDKMVAKRFGLRGLNQYIMTVKNADKIALHNEMNILFDHKPAFIDKSYLKYSFKPLPPVEAKKQFLEKYNSLFTHAADLAMK